MRTDNYKGYTNHVMYLLRPLKLEIPEGKLEIRFTWGVATAASDTDNPCKPFLDILSKYYDFNDNKVYRIIQEKKVVGKGNEFIDFEILKYEHAI